MERDAGGLEDVEMPIVVEILHQAQSGRFGHTEVIAGEKSQTPAPFE